MLGRILHPLDYCGHIIQISLDMDFVDDHYKSNSELAYEDLEHNLRNIMIRGHIDPTVFICGFHRYVNLYKRILTVYTIIPTIKMLWYNYNHKYRAYAIDPDQEYFIEYTAKFGYYEKTVLPIQIL